MSPKGANPNPENLEESSASIQKSSCKGIWKYPTNRVSPFKNAVNWLEDKKKDDNIGDFWRVHDKIYDVSPFIKNHPGGSEWLIMSRGLDITELFESSHIVNSSLVEKVLEKYYVRDATTPRNSPYNFKPNGFYRTIKQAAEPILKKAGTGSTLQIRMMQDGLGLAFIILSILGIYLNSWTLKILAGITLTMTANAAHNFLHMKENWRRYYMDLSFMASYEMRSAHILSHHCYPNTVLDAEMSLTEPILTFLPTDKKSWWLKYGPIFYCHFVFATLYWFQFIHRWIAIVKGTHRFMFQDLIVFVELLVFTQFSTSFSDALISWTVIHTVSSYYFGLFSFTVAHHHPTIFHDGDECRIDPDFGLCQLDAVRERSDSIYKNLFFVLTRYGEHSLHHLFPTVCHSKLELLKPALESTLEKFNEELIALPEWELYLGTFKQLQRTEPKPFTKLKKN